MNDNPPPFVEGINSAMKEAGVFLSIARCSELQQEAIESLKVIKAKVSLLKGKAIAERNENHANILLGYECDISSLIAELEMWILLKQENPDAAWDKLILAQMAVHAAIRAHAGFGDLIQRHKRLEEIEELIFPPQVFMSPGMLVKSLKCSICGKEYEDCEHLVGKPYMGEFCQTISQGVEIDHVSIVDCPADKRCRITAFQVEKGTRNRMTWRIEKMESDEKPQASSESAERRATAKIALDELP